MTSKERVAQAFAHEEPDRTPINYWSNPGIDQRLKQHFGLDGDDDEGLRQALGVDFRQIQWPEYIGATLHQEIPERRINIWGARTRWVEHESGGYWDYCDFPLQNASMEEIEAWAFPSPDDFDYMEMVARSKEWSDYCVVTGGAGVGDIINSTGMVRGMEQVLVDLVTDDPAGLRLMDRKLEVQVEIIRRMLEAADGAFDLLWLGEDLGTQRGPILSLELFRRHIRPRHQKFVDLARAWDIPAIIHSCGSSSWAFDDFIEMGMSGVDTLQPEAKDMAPAYLKDRFGERLTFHGMISTAGPLAYGTVDEVVANVRETLKIMMPGGGYCLAPTHRVQDNSPTENVVALYEAAQEFGRYG